MHDKLGVAERREIDEADAAGKLLVEVSSNLKRESGLSDATRTDKRRDGNIIATQQIGHCRSLPAPTDKGSALGCRLGK